MLVESPNQAILNIGSEIQRFELRSRSDDSDFIRVFDRRGNLEGDFSIIKETELVPSKNKITQFEFQDKRFEEDYRKAKSLIANKVIKKAVVYNSLNLEFERKIQIEDFLRFDFNGEHNIYALWGKNSGKIGISPEILYHARDTHCELVALAGTSKSSENLFNTKLASEHNFVIDDIKEKLFDLDYRYVQEPQRILKYGDYFHLLTKILVKSEINSKELISKFAPTAALGGYPSKAFEKSKDELSFEQDYKKKQYGGILELKKGNDQKAIVMIRNITWSGNRAEINAGCGIVGSSGLKEELDESHMKALNVLRYFNYEID